MYSDKWINNKGELNMKNKYLYIGLLISLLLIIFTADLNSQNKRTGTSAATELLIPVGARDFAMGGSTISNTFGVEAIHWNPAGLGIMKYSAEGMFSTMSYIGDIGVHYGAAGISFGDFGVVGLTLKSLSFGDIPLTTNEDPEGLLGRVFSPTYFTLGLTYSRALTDAISFGITTKLISENIDRVSATGFAADLGVIYRNLANLRGLNVGVTVKNIGPQMKFDGTGLLRNAISSDGRRPEQRYKSEAASFELPSLIEIGLAYTGSYMENISYSFNTSFTNNNLYLDEYRFGGEIGYSISDLKLFGRTGIGFFPQEEAEDQIFGATFGVGLAYKTPGLDIIIDYAYRQVDFFDGNNVFSIKLGF